MAVEQLVANPVSKQQCEDAQQAHHAGADATCCPSHGTDPPIGPRGDDPGYLLLQRLEKARAQQEAQRPQKTDRRIGLRP
ncbi:MAG: hypothetical protein CL467_03765 [Acidimicrobiaceae bacterium]|nr:hypothetical protein [Acidimicrobiaceae bacterium]